MANKAAILPAKAQPLEIIERPVPSTSLAATDVLIHNQVIAVNPVDFYRQKVAYFVHSYPCVLGNDVAGTVVAVGDSVTGIQPGDRVLALMDGFLNGDGDRGGFQTYCVASSLSTSRIPDNVSLHAAATLPTAVATSVTSLFDVLGLPLPSASSQKDVNKIGLIVWNGGGSVGTVAVQLAHLAGIPVLATASPKHNERLLRLGATAVVDYHGTPETVGHNLAEAAKKAGLQGIGYAMDATSDASSLASIAKAFALAPVQAGEGEGHEGHQPKRTVTYLRALPEGFEPADGIEYKFTTGGSLRINREDLARWVFGEQLQGWLARGELEPLPHRVVPGGLEGLQDAVNQVGQGIHGEKLEVELSAE